MAEGDDQDSKTEQASGKRLGEARDKGQLPISRETSTWVVMLGILGVVHWMLGPMISEMQDYLRSFIEAPQAYDLDIHNVQTLLYQVVGRVGLITGLIFCVLMAAVIGGIMVQTGFFFSFDLIEFDFTRLMPSKGFKRLFSGGSLVELGKTFFKLLLLGGLAFGVLAPVAYEAPTMTGLPLEGLLVYLQGRMTHLIVMLILGFTAIAAGDLFYTRFQYLKNLRMTKAEVKDEFKQMEGDPAIKGRLRQMRLERSRKRMMAQVPKADVVITNPTHYAVALKYDSVKMTAPLVLAKGINLIAERIREVAEESRIPLVSNPPLARALHDTVEVDQQIPTQHYRAVAEIISYVYKLKKRFR
jgi:flagellar biosynthetic protein FlhB